MTSVFIRSFGATCVAVALAGPALACEGVPVPFVAPNAAAIAAGVQMNGGQITLRPKVNDDYFYEYGGWGSDDVDFCAVVTAVAGNGTDGGLVFWEIDSSDEWTFAAATNGQAYVSHLHDGDWDDLLPLTTSPSLRRGVGASNELRVVTQGRHATFFINGQKFFEGDRTDTKARRRIGLIATSTNQVKAVFSFDNVTMRAVATTSPVGTIGGAFAPPAGGNTAPVGGNTGNGVAVDRPPAVDPTPIAPRQPGVPVAPGGRVGGGDRP